MDEKNEIKWDLSIIYENNEKIKEFIAQSEKDLENLQIEYKDRINRDNITSKELFEFLEKFNSVYEQASDLYYFTGKQLDADQTIKESLKVNNTALNMWTKTTIIKTAFELEIGQLSSRRPELLQDPQLHNYKHYLEKLVNKTKYLLSPKEEEIIAEKDSYGKLGWEKLQSEWLSSREFKIIDQGEEKTVTWGDYGKYTQSPIRETRKSAMVNMVGEKGLAKDKEIFAASLRNICGDHVSMVKQRKYPSTYTSSILTNDITEKMLNDLLEVVKENRKLYHEFLLLKAKIMGTEKLLGEDLWVPIDLKGVEEYQNFKWEEAKAIILDVFDKYDQEFGSIAKKMFDENHIDASPRKGKRAGAYCSTVHSAKEAFILMSFNENITDVSTLAHEMGHAIHSYLATENIKFLNDGLSFCTAEVASEFGRFLHVDYLMDRGNDLLKKYILFNHLEELATIIFEVGSRTVFEKSLYDALKNGEYLDATKISELFLRARKTFFGDAIEFLPEQQYDWIWKPHYYRPDIRYYNYPYYFAELLVLAFYNMYKKERKAFLPRFRSFLAAGGSKSALELGKNMGINLEEKDFWQRGMEEFETLLKEAKKIFS